jgi:GTP-binding protein
MLASSATYIKSSEFPSQCPSDGLPEYAFIGRSNVGKSSLINAITGNSKLSKVSGTPGKTRLISHFMVDKSWYLVDLPGYGYAKASKDARQRFSSVVTRYIAEREILTMLFVLVDVRLTPQKIDLAFVQRLGEHGIPFALAFTKADKVSDTKQRANVELFQRALLEAWDELPPAFVTSSETGMGCEAIVQYIQQVNSTLKKI